jgi:glycosyltransferase involved in cell wall biosynthesis
MLASCSAVIANTEHEAEFMSARGAVRIEVAGVGVDLPFFASPNGAGIRARYGIGDKPVVGFVGRPQASKGIIRLVEAMRIVWQWNPDVRFVCAGHGPAECSDVQVEAALNNLRSAEPDRFIRIGLFEAKDKPSLYDAFDVFVLPSTEESFGLAYLEAWACRKPVIGADIGSTRCVIDDKSDGLLVNPSDPADIAQKIIELLSDRSKRESMGSRGYAKAQARYSWPRVVDRVERLYRDLCAG